ncbi:MAG: hypothetical protein D3923_11865, partial [Candidatus Electrothrix sp. AR3]|nr:hypothetical protein [Candidatus Electrothrix sp. AR3]
ITGIVLTRNWETDRDQAQFKLRNVTDVKAAAYDAVESGLGLTAQFGPCDDPMFSFTIPGSEIDVTYLNLRYTVGNLDVVRCVFNSEQCVINIRNTDLDNEALDEALTGDMTVSLKVGNTTYSDTGVYTQYESGSGSWTKYRKDK